MSDSLTFFFYRISAMADTQKTLESFFPTHLNYAHLDRYMN